MSTSVVHNAPSDRRSFAAKISVKSHELMVRSRLLEERLIRMQKQGDGYFWIGGPGEEAFNVALGLLVHKGEGARLRLSASALSLERDHARDGRGIPWIRCVR